MRNRSFALRVVSRLSRKTSDVFDTLIQKQQSKWGNKSGPLLSGIFYCIASCSMILLNKVVLSSYNFDAGISLMLYQVIQFIWTSCPYPFKGNCMTVVPQFYLCGVSFVFQHLLVCDYWQLITIELIRRPFMIQNFVCVVILLILELFHVITTEELTWKLIKVWIPVNLIFIGMLVTGMYRYFLLHTACS